MSIPKYIFELVAAIVLALAFLWWSYAYFSEDILNFFQVETEYQIYLGEAGLTVTIADEPAEWQQGLSGLKKLDDTTGKLFIFIEAGLYGMWMKDMLIPIDMIWIDEEFTVIHIESNVIPNTYPKTFASDEPARFILETNALFADTFNIKIGSKLKLPTLVIPPDLRN